MQLDVTLYSMTRNGERPRRVTWRLMACSRRLYSVACQYRLSCGQCRWANCRDFYFWLSLGLAERRLRRFITFFVTSFSVQSIYSTWPTMSLIYSIASRNVSTFEWRLSSRAYGTTCRSRSKPLLIVFMRDRSRLFAAIRCRVRNLSRGLRFPFYLACVEWYLPLICNIPLRSFVSS